MKGDKSKAESKRSDAKSSVNKIGATLGIPKKPTKVKAPKDPNKPKRSPNAFFIFMEEFRKQFNKENPENKAVSAVGKAAGSKWKTMSDAEKAPYVEQSEKLKVEYEKKMIAYSKKQVEEGTSTAGYVVDNSVFGVNDKDDRVIHLEDTSDEEEDD